MTILTNLKELTDPKGLGRINRLHSPGDRNSSRAPSTHRKKTRPPLIPASGSLGPTQTHTHTKQSANLNSFHFCQLQTGTCQEHLPATEQQQGWLCHRPLGRLNLGPCSCWPSAPSEGNSGWSARHSVLQRNRWNRSLDGSIFSGTDFMIPVLASLPF